MIDIFYSMFEPIKEVANWVLIHVNEQQGALVVLASTAIVGAAGAYFGSIGAQRSINREMALRRRIEKIAVLLSVQIWLRNAPVTLWQHSTI